VHPPIAKSHDNIVKVEQETPPGTSQSTNENKGKRASFFNILDKLMEVVPTILHENEGSSHIIGGGKHPFAFPIRLTLEGIKDR